MLPESPQRPEDYDEEKIKSWTGEAIGPLEKRTLADADLIKRGARYREIPNTPRPLLEVGTHEIRHIHNDMEEGVIQKALEKTMHGEEGELIRRAVRENFDSKVLRQAQDIISGMRQHAEMRGKTAITGDVPFREDLREKIFFGNVESFKRLVEGLPVVNEMVELAVKDGVVIDHNVHQAIFEHQEYLLKRDDDEGREYRSKYEKQLARHGEVEEARDKKEWTRKWHHLNPLAFERADVRAKIVYKILDNIMGGDWEFGSTLELGKENVYHSGSLERALVDRLGYVTEKWRFLSKEDKIAWLGGEWTHSQQARQGGYDQVKLASDNTYTG